MVSIKEIRYKKITIVLLLIFLLGVVTAVGYINFHKAPESVSANGDETAEFVKKMSDKEFKQYLQEKVDNNNFHLKMDSTMEFDSANSVGKVSILNPSSNKYVIRVRTSLENKQEIIYDSGMIEPTFYVEEGKLLKSISKGVYKTQNKVSYYERKTDKLVGETIVVGQLSVNN